MPVISDEHLTRLIEACEPGKRTEGTPDDVWRRHQLVCHRDEALVRMLIDCGVCCLEVTNLTVGDVDRDAQVIFVVGKGRGPRAVPYGNRTSQAVDRYVRSRTRHPEADSNWLWLGSKGRLTDSGLRQMLERRGDKAGIGRVYPHQFRHPAAHKWMAEGGAEGDLMQLLGWRSGQMLNRYGASAAAERARDAHRRMGIGDRL